MAATGERLLAAERQRRVVWGGQPSRVITYKRSFATGGYNVIIALGVLSSLALLSVDSQ